MHAARAADPRPAVTGAKADERQVLLGMLDDADLSHLIAGTTLIADNNYCGSKVGCRGVGCAGG